MVLLVVEAAAEEAVAKEVEVEAAAEEATEDEGRGVVWANILDSDEIRGKVDVVVVVLLRSNRLVVV
jgi:hypothetical protein